MDKWAKALRLVGVGWFIATAIAVGLMAGIWLDSVVGTMPMFTLAGVMLGLVVAFRGIYQLLKPFADGKD